MTIKTLILAAAIATLGTTSVLAQDAMKPDAMAAHKMTKAEKKTHDAMMKHDAMAKHDAMKHDAMKPDAMKSSTPH